MVTLHYRFGAHLHGDACTAGAVGGQLQRVRASSDGGAGCIGSQRLPALGEPPGSGQ